MNLRISTPGRIFTSRVKLVLQGEMPIAGLNKLARGLAKQVGPTTLTHDSQALPSPIAETLEFHQIHQVNITSHAGITLTSDVQTAITASLRCLAIENNAPNVVEIPKANLGVILTTPTQPMDKTTAIDIYNIKDPAFTSQITKTKNNVAELILNKLPKQKIFSANYWRGLLANVVMADAELIGKYSEVTNKMVELETGSLSYFAKARTFAKFFRQTFEPKDRTFLLKLGALAATLSPALFYFVFSQAVRQAAKLFIAGENATEANKVMNSLSQNNIGYVLDFVAEEATDEPSAQRNINSYIKAINELQTKQEKVVSVKLTGLVKHFSDRIALGDETAEMAKAEAIEALNKILEVAHAKNAVVIIDLERFSIKNVTQAILIETIQKSNYKYAGNLGIVIQTYLHFSLTDIEILTAFAKECHEATNGQSQLFIRFVKGAYQNSDKEYVLDSHEAVNQRFIACLKLAYKNFEAIRFAIASHNLRTISEAIELANTMGLNADKLEFEMLLGMPATPLMYALAKMGRTCRFYMPVGSFFESLGYFMRRMVENANSSSCQTLFKQFAAKKLALEEYLAKVFSPIV